MRQMATSPRPSIFDILGNPSDGDPDWDPAESLPRQAPLLGQSSRRRSLLIPAILGLFGAAGLCLWWTLLPSTPGTPDSPSQQSAVSPPLQIERLTPQLQADTMLAPAGRDGVTKQIPPKADRQPATTDVPSETARTKLVQNKSAQTKPVQTKPAQLDLVQDKILEPTVSQPTVSQPTVFQPAVKIFAPQPEYPDAARQKNLAGNVVIEASIDTGGAVSSTRVIRGVAPELNQAARDVVSQWRFEPARRDGVPVADSYRVSIRFTLTQPAENAALQAKPVATGADVEPPVKLFTPPPHYPQADWLDAVEGDVVLKATIDIRGMVSEIEVLEGLSPGLDQAAIAALEQWRFRPATRQGQPVAAHQVLRFRFAR